MPNKYNLHESLCFCITATLCQHGRIFHLCVCDGVISAYCKQQQPRLVFFHYYLIAFVLQLQCCSAATSSLVQQPVNVSQVLLMEVDRAVPPAPPSVTTWVLHESRTHGAARTSPGVRT